MASLGARLIKLRELMKNSSYCPEGLHAYIIPYSDAHQSEILVPYYKRLEFITGFSGTYGTAIVTDTKAALWTDSRYFNQAGKQLTSDWSLMKFGLPDTPSQSKWLSNVLSENSRVGFDPDLLTYSAWKSLAGNLNDNGHSLVPVSPNLVDVIWTERPAPRWPGVDALPIQFTGKTWQEKIALVQKEMAENKVSVLVLTHLDEIAWLFNLRGRDTDYSPIFFSYAVLTSKEVHLFVNEDRLTRQALESLTATESLTGLLAQSIHPYENIRKTLRTICDMEKDGKVWISPRSSYTLVSMIPEERRMLKTTPVALQKAIKNETEILGAKYAHIKDAVALVEFFAWLCSAVPKGEVTELTAAKKLEHFRSLQKDFVSLSFETISASGPNGAIVHYRPNSETARRITTEDMYVCDSGGQYLDGTTDVTRTLHFGSPMPFQKICYTLVLKGQIALSSAKFPKLVKGNSIDAFARRYLWEYGLDYSHGTGHGVGAFLNVHEGPIGIGQSSNPNDPGLQAGMILSIEPGYYEDDNFGIRLENLALVKECLTHYQKRKEFLTFESLTLVPYQSNLIEPTLLTREEVKWINEYHAMCKEILVPIFKEQGKTEALSYILKETLPLG